MNFLRIIMVYASPSVKAVGAEAVSASLKQYPSYPLEMFDVSVTCIGNIGGEEGTRLNIRLLVKKGDDGSNSLKVLLVKKNEIKDEIFNILNLHRYVF